MGRYLSVCEGKDLYIGTPPILEASKPLRNYISLLARNQRTASCLAFPTTSIMTAVKAGYWSSTSGFSVASIDSSHFTHLFCAFADLDPLTYQVNFPATSATISRQFLTFTQTVQRRNSNVKTLLSIGGPDSDPSTFAQMANQRSNRAAFISSSIQLARTNNFHGLDLCWLYPSTNPESNDLGTLLNEWRNAITDEADGSGNEPLLLTAQVFYSPLGLYRYPVSVICLRLDWINLLAYSYHTPSNSPNQTRAHAAWTTRGQEPSGESGINAWIAEARNNKIKIVLGLPFFGYAWVLVNENNNQVSAPASGAPANLQPDGLIGYNQIATFAAQRTATTVFDTVTQTNYVYDKTTWISFDDRRAITNKIEKAKEKQQELIGYFAWHVGFDNNWSLSRLAAQQWG
ncbi:Chitinase-3-like protein 1 [Morella rubra]|uniref:Chitinase-3-like protein 1 n=1 Tax=Morella rubra TaxID=262757 RepID=A0A6A1VIW7_9ROSI|nr:Chitinase-3-like protein 1 [Morella rubra]